MLYSNLTVLTYISTYTYLRTINDIKYILLNSGYFFFIILLTIIFIIQFFYIFNVEFNNYII